MISVTIALTVALLQTPDKVFFRDNKLGLQFEHPKVWKVRRDKFSAVFEIPMAAGQTAMVQIYHANYKGTLDDWQLIQLEINKSMQRTVERQWQEEYLGVPMVLTKIQYNDAGRGKVGIVGLLYTSYADKMHFRLTTPAEVAEQAEASWREVMLTLRTLSGELPNVENPNLPSVKPEPEKTTTVWEPKNGNGKAERGPLVVESQQGETKFKFFLPNDWSIKDQSLGVNGLSGSLKIAATVGLPEEAGQRLVDLAKGQLPEFESVQLREDPKSQAVSSGAIVGKVFRVGKSKGQTAVLGSIVGYCEGVFWELQYRATDANSWARDRQKLEELFRLLYVERA